MIYTILLILLVLALIGSLPVYGYSSNWSYYPSGGVVLLIILVIVLMGRA
jgi:hypothetical protein